MTFFVRQKRGLIMSCLAPGGPGTVVVVESCHSCGACVRSLGYDQRKAVCFLSRQSFVLARRSSMRAIGQFPGSADNLLLKGTDFEKQQGAPTTTHRVPHTRSVGRSREREKLLLVIIAHNGGKKNKKEENTSKTQVNEGQEREGKGASLLTCVPHVYPPSKISR